MKQLAFAVAGALALVGVASAETLHVANNGLDTQPCTLAEPCRTISRAVELATAGDTVLVGPGRYGDINPSGTYDRIDEETGGLIPGSGAGVYVAKKLTILSTRGAELTVIDMGGATDAAVRIVADGVRFGDRNAGFTVTGGQNFGLIADATGVVVAGNIITRQTFAGLYLVSKGLIEARANTLVDNTTGILALHYNPGNYVQMSGNTLKDNQVGIATSALAAHRITGNEFSGNFQGIGLNYGASRVSGNQFVNNRWGVMVNGYSHEPQTRGPVITHNSFISNLATGIIVYPGPPGIGVNARENNFFGNEGCGVANLRQDIAVDARFSFWGASTGPSFLNPADEACPSTLPTLTAPFASSAIDVR